MKVKHGYYDVFVRTCARSPSNIAVRHYQNGVYKTYSYSELYGVCEYMSQILQQLHCNRGIIGLVSERNVIIPCIIAAAHKCSTTFMFLDPTQDLENFTKEIKFRMVITVSDKDTEISLSLFSKEPVKTVDVFNLNINFYSFDQNSNVHLPEYSFITMTSGSTGQPKHIQVPIQCIQPNVDDLTKLFRITSQDIIYFSTPLTFDPSMIEILLACINGASLLIAPEKADILFPSNPRNSITFWQVTPSRFFQFSNADIKNKILGPNSTLRILALGGEPLNGVKRLIELKHWENKTQIFTLYGVSEMSCWACVAHLNLNRILTDREVPLGDCLSETQIIVEPDKNDKNTGKILLVSKSRKCIILNSSHGNEENSLRFIDTGDMAEVKNGTIYYRGRRDDVVKRFGHKINLQFIEATIMQCPRIKTCSCVWLPKPRLLVVYFSSETMSSQEVSDFLKCKLDDKHWPDKIIRVTNMPTNPHGKISKLIISKLYESMVKVPQTSHSLRASFLQEVQSVLSSNVVYEDIKSKDFFAIGGTSFLAVAMCNKLSQTCPKFGKLILPYLMSQRLSIEEIMQIAEKEICVIDRKVKKRTKRSRSDMTSQITLTSSLKKAYMEDVADPMEFIVQWTYDTGKCVDASPVLYQTARNLYVVVGSHSGKIVVVDAMSGSARGVLGVRARVEARALCFQSDHKHARAVVGAHDGTIVCFSLEDCKEVWKTCIGSMVKSRPVICHEVVYVAAYDGKIHCFDKMSGKAKAEITIVDQAISADLVLAKNEFILVGSLSGICACVHARTNAVTWRGALSSPVFASPVLYDKDKYVVFAEVNGEIHCRTVEKGIKIWKYQGAKGNVFSSLYIREVDKLKWQMIFGCHDCHVYSILIKNFQPALSWRTELPSPVYATPCGLNHKLVLAAATNGKICALDCDSGAVAAERLLPNEIFSSPAVYGDYVFIGCRDDNLYSLKYVVNF
ncbi:beta-alanine-activating enzyme [Plodia interpunctella]|uniref:beta-alanine-activating enzyme n=1 Tax=Plodia interpunctella TaxID=58824 RepID=UPI0023681042|nr:beta-alanine-activating enzyme [Plodia interpunctella]